MEMMVVLAVIIFPVVFWNIAYRYGKDVGFKEGYWTGYAKAKSEVDAGNI